LRGSFLVYLNVPTTASSNEIVRQKNDSGMTQRRITMIADKTYPVEPEDTVCYYEEFRDKPVK
jgi:uncharacterized protein YfaP (DUF2135 family)